MLFVRFLCTRLIEGAIEITLGILWFCYDLFIDLPRVLWRDFWQSWLNYRGAYRHQQSLLRKDDLP